MKEIEQAASDPILRIYLREIGRIPLLMPEKELELFVQLEKARGQKRDEIRKEIIEANLRLVVNIAKVFRRGVYEERAQAGLDFLDLIQAGNTGLMKAVDRFDYRKGYKLSSYASWWIRQAIMRELREHGSLIRIAVHRGDAERKIVKALADLRQEFQEEETAQEALGQATGFSPEEIEEAFRVKRLKGIISLDSELSDFIHSEELISPGEEVFWQEVRESIEEVLQVFSARDAEIIRLRFGLKGEPWTFERVGKKFGITGEAVRQIQERVLAKLSQMPKLQEFLEE